MAYLGRHLLRRILVPADKASRQSLGVSPSVPFFKECLFEREIVEGTKPRLISVDNFPKEVYLSEKRARGHNFALSLSVPCLKTLVSAQIDHGNTASAYLRHHLLRRQLMVETTER